MIGKFWVALLAASSVFAQGTSSVGTATRDLSPSTLIFSIEQLGAEQYQDYIVAGGGSDDLWVMPEDSCRPWIIAPGLYSTYGGVIGAVARSAGTFSCSVAVYRGIRTVGTIRVILNAGAGARAGTSPGIAAPNSLTLPRTGQIHTISINPDSYSATLVRMFPYLNAGFAVSTSALAQPGSVSIRATANTFSDITEYANLYVETPSGMEVVRMTIPPPRDVRLVADPPTFNLKYQAGGAAPAVSFTITDSRNSNFATTATSGASWARVSADGQPITPVTYNVAINPASLANGLNSTAITVRTGVGEIIVPIVVKVTGSDLVPGGFVTDVSSLTFNAVAGASAPSGQTVKLTTAGSIDYTPTASTQNGGNSWLRLVPQATLNSATNPSFQVVVDHSGLTAGTYTGSVTITATISRFTKVIPITLVVSPGAPATTPAITATPPSLSFTYRQGGPLPTPVSLQIAGTAGISFAAAPNQPWLGVNPAAGTLAGPVALTVSTLAAGMPFGTHNASIVITPTGGAAAVTVPVTLTVTAPLPTVTKVTNAASYAEGPIAPGEIVTIFGENLGPVAGAGLTIAADGRVDTNAGGVEVLIGGYACPILYAGANQISAVVPYEIAQAFIASPNVLVKYRGQTSNGFPATQANSAPAIFTANSSGTGPGAILNGDSSYNTPDQPAVRGEVVQLFVTGEGQTIPAGATGKITTVSATGPLTPQPILGVRVTIDGIPAKVLFYGEAPNIVAGLMQINVEAPAGARPGNVPVVVTIGGGPDERSTQDGVTVALR